MENGLKPTWHPTKASYSKNHSPGDQYQYPFSPMRNLELSLPECFVQTAGPKFLQTRVRVFLKPHCMHHRGRPFPDH